jgi:hypothetical protein
MPSILSAIDSFLAQAFMPRSPRPAKISATKRANRITNSAIETARASEGKGGIGMVDPEGKTHSDEVKNPE